jgi:hypothetical protein
MKHLKLYTETVADLQFKGETASTTGTVFRCNTCNETFQIKGVLSELEGEAKKAFLDKFKTNHSRHKCKVEVESKSSSDESEEDSAEPTIDPASIETWTVREVHNALAHGSLPAQVEVIKHIPRAAKLEHIPDHALCRISNEHGTVDHEISHNILYHFNPNSRDKAVALKQDFEREALVSKCVR